MRRVVLNVCCLMALADAGRAQISLSAGTYTQDFTTLGAGLPAGWSVFTSASASSNGTAGTFTPAATAWNAGTAGTDFRNIAGNTIATNANTATQNAEANRALGWRPLTAASRNGAVVATFANTTGLAITALSVVVFTANDASTDQTYQFEFRSGGTGNFTQIGSTYTTGAPFNTATLSADPTTLSALSNQSGPIEIRLRGTATSGTSLDTLGIDHFILTAATMPLSITSQPVSQNIAPGQTAMLSVTAAGPAPLTYRWRKAGTPLNTITYPSATTATLNLGVVSSADSGDYDVVVTDSTNASLTSSTAHLVVAITPATVTLDPATLAAVFDGNPHAVTATTSPAGLSLAITYSGQANTPPINAGTYPIVATITAPAYSGSASGNLVITPAPQAITFTTLAGNTPLIGVPFTVSATASGGVTPVRFSASGNATATGTNNATITLSDSDPVTITATQAGDANNAAATPATLTVVAAAPAAISGTYTQTFDTLGTALPAGWRVFTGASATSLGTDISGVPSSLLLAPTDWSSATGNFRNVASALNSGITGAENAAAQSAFTNRALGVRQNASLDPGAAFGFNFATTGVNLVSVSFSAQILSEQADATIWLLQSAVGPNPTAWTTLATFNDPGVFGATSISVNASALGTALNNQSNVWLRVVALAATIFGGTRDTFAIDNFTIVTAPVARVTTPPVALTRTSGQSASFTVAAVGTGGLAYQWRKNGIAITGNASALTPTLVLPNVRTGDAGGYDVVVTDSIGSATSPAATLTVNPIATTIAFSNLTAIYDSHPHAALATSAPSGASIALTYAGFGATPYAASATPPTSVGTYAVTALVTDGEHIGTASTLLVIAGAAGATAPAVTAVPSNQTLIVGDTLTLTIAVTGSPAPALQWRKNGAAIPGATHDAFTIAHAALDDAGTYDVIVANPGGTLVSASAVVAIAKKSQTISFDAPAAAVATSNAIPLTATATSGLAVGFTIVSGAGAIVDRTLRGAGGFVVVRASQAGDATTYAAAANVDRTFTFVNGGNDPFLFNTPSDQIVDAGANVTFSAAAIGTPAPTWQWQKDGVAIAGATHSSLTLSQVTLADAARYTAVATNPFGAASANATLTVRTAPVFLASPIDQSATAGAAVTFTAVVAGFPAPAWQWRKDGVAIAGAVSSTLTLTNVRAGDAARYDVVATNVLGAATSAAATLTITTRDFSGTYFGKFAGTEDDFALHVRANGPAVFLGYVRGTDIGLVTTRLTVDANGNFSLNFAPLAHAHDEQPSAFDFESGSSPAARAASAITLLGSVSETTGALVATVPELGLTLAGARIPNTDVAAVQAGFYSGALLGSADGRSYVIVGPDGQAFVLIANDAAIDAAKGTLDAHGHLTLTTANHATLTLGFVNGGFTGTMRTADGLATTLGGAVDTLIGTERLANISAQGVVTRGAPLIIGFAVTGSAAKQVLIRAAGPTLSGPPFNLAGALDDPALRLFRGNTLIAQNDNWDAADANSAALSDATTRVGAFAFRRGSADAALLTTLAPGSYTVQVTAANDSSLTDGTGLAEIYEILESAEPVGTRRLANLSARGPVAPGAPLIAGFVIHGTAPQRVLVRGVGPALAAFGVAGGLANPTLTLFRDSTIVKTNDDWFRDPDAMLVREAGAKSGAFALGASSLDAALLLYLEPGAYTAQVSASGSADVTGAALVELYEVGP